MALRQRRLVMLETADWVHLLLKRNLTVDYSSTCSLLSLLLI